MEIILISSLNQIAREIAIWFGLEHPLTVSRMESIIMANAEIRPTLHAGDGANDLKAELPNLSTITTGDAGFTNPPRA